MATTASPKGLLFVKIAAVAFAVTACGYIVITGHEKANPPAEAPAPADVPPADGVPAAAGDAAATPSKKPDPAFFYSSKSMPLTDPLIKDESELTDEADEVAKKKREAVERALMPSSKSLIMPKPKAAKKKAKPAPKATK